MTNTTTVHRALEFDGSTPSEDRNFLRVDELENGNAFLEVRTSWTESDKTTENAGRIYLSPEQWAELAQVALKYATGEKDSNTHWMNAQVAAWQADNRRAKELTERNKIVKHLLHMSKLDGSYYPQHRNDIMVKLEAEGLAEAEKKDMGNFRWWKLTPAGVIYAENLEA